MTPSPRVAPDAPGAYRGAAWAKPKGLVPHTPGSRPPAPAAPVPRWPRSQSKHRYRRPRPRTIGGTRSSKPASRTFLRSAVVTKRNTPGAFRSRVVLRGPACPCGGEGRSRRQACHLPTPWCRPWCIRRLVDAQADHLVDAERRNRRASASYAAGGEEQVGLKARQGEQHDLAAAEDVGAGPVLPAIGVRPADALVADAGLEGDVGYTHGWGPLGWVGGPYLELFYF